MIVSGVGPLLQEPGSLQRREAGVYDAGGFAGGVHLDCADERGGIIGDETLYHWC